MSNANENDDAGEIRRSKDNFEDEDENEEEDDLFAYFYSAYPDLAISSRPMRHPRQLLRATLCFALVLAAGGCSSATNALWDRKAYHPAYPPSIRLALDTNRQDILVRYKEQVNYSSHRQERAYWLLASTNSPTTSRAPVFLADSDLASLKDLIDVPLYHSKKDLRHSSAPGYAAITWTGLNEFELWRDGKKIQTYELPAYYSPHAPATSWRVALTPLSVTGDVVLTTSGVAFAIPVGIVYGVVYVGMTSAPGTWNFSF